jgi:ASC-1-like (ASCH) protein
MTHQMRLATEYFEKIKNGTKTIECRLFDDKRKLLKVGDHIEFSDTKNEQNKVMSEIIALHEADSFSELLDRSPIAQFGGDTKEQFYSDKDEKKFGVVGIEIKLV